MVKCISDDLFSDYMAAIDEEKKNAVRKLEGEKRELKIENENLKKKLAGKKFFV